MIQIKDLTIIHKKDLRVLLKSFSMVLQKGDKAAIIGEEGNGKSTLLKLIYDEQLVTEYIEYTGEIIRNHTKIGYLSQEWAEEESDKSAYEYFSEKDAFFDQTPKELASIAKKVNLKNDIFYSDQKVKEFSGGEKIKLQIAGILMERPDVLLLDEPSNDLDRKALEWLEHFIIQSDLPILYISHDEMLLEHTANKIVHLEQIRRKTQTRYTVAKMPYKVYAESRKGEFEHQEQVARKERSEYEKQQEKFRKIQQKVEHQQNVITRQNPFGGRLLKKKMHAVKAQERRFEKKYENLTELPESEEAIFLKIGCNHIPNGKNVLELSLDSLMVSDQILSKSIHLEVYGSQKVCIIGKNGVGKTTLIRKIADIMQKRTDINAFYMPQNYLDVLDFQQTPVEFLTRTGGREEESQIRTYLGSMKYTVDEMEHKISELSGGQKAKLLFLKMSMGAYDVLILDEPTRNISPLSAPVIRNILNHYRGAIISVSHDRKYIDEVCDTRYELTKQGLKRVESY